ncbi:hypothetical protein ARHIZOSPH14_33280 [Agromyces rhizosphaerae]|uniref:DUF3040 domain-containing protein n=1 Tax=Agromyces rhizosphaerae TaxID=88374 RepID=A0A9W6FR03_9MICO|nr:DUF3040 domain-containing protein [Agromyces rhizosphaerae]GLI29086.1 hypothetical protein ARHIZOSPH14_33280 [Agromyces rhizosphaerae]
MPLSEQEQRLLEEMERSLYRNDADFVATVGGRRGRPNYRSVVLGVLLGVAGVGALIAGVATQLLFIGIIGFALMFLGVLLAISPSRKVSVEELSDLADGQRSGRGSGSAGFMDRMNQRWDRRQEERD